MRLPRTASVTPFSASRWRTSAGRRRRSGKGRVALPSIPVGQELQSGPYNQYQLARIYILVGEHGEGARSSWNRS